MRGWLQPSAMRIQPTLTARRKKAFKKKKRPPRPKEPTSPKALNPTSEPVAPRVSDPLKPKTRTLGAEISTYTIRIGFL